MSRRVDCSDCRCYYLNYVMIHQHQWIHSFCCSLCGGYFPACHETKVAQMNLLTSIEQVGAPQVLSCWSSSFCVFHLMFEHTLSLHSVAHNSIANSLTGCPFTERTPNATCRLMKKAIETFLFSSSRDGLTFPLFAW